VFETFSLPQLHPDIDNPKKFEDSGLPIVTVDPDLMDTLIESPVMRNLSAKLQEFASTDSHTIGTSPC
jgi:hypothetical protein